MTKKKLFLYLGMLAVIAFVAIILAMNFSKKKINSGNPEFAEYIAAYTSGVISKASPIQVKLTPDVLNEIDDESILPPDLFSFRPKVKGQYSLSGNILEFKPEENMKSDKKYHVQFHLDELKDVKKELKNFNFEFKTIPQAFDYNVKEQKTIDRKALKYQQINGVVETADLEENDKVSKVLTAYQGSEELVIKWKTDVYGLSHSFTIDSIRRFDKPSEIVVKWDGDPINVKKEGEDKISIPAVGEFNLMSSKVIQQPEQYLQLQFSDPLNEKQNLEGLISVEGENHLKYIIEDNTIKVYTESRINTLKNIKIHTGIKNILGFKLKKEENFQIAYEAIKPAVKIIGDGSILPSSDKGLIFPFEAVNLKAVELTVIKIYEDNVLQFLQINDADGDYQLRRVGKPVVHKVLKLDKYKVADRGIWNKYSLDLNDLIEAEPGAIYRIEIGFRKHHAIWDCSDEDAEEDDDNLKSVEDDWTNEDEDSNWDSYESYYGGNSYYYGYWEDRDNPCKQAYYGKKKVASRNIVASDLGIIAKQANNNEVSVYVTDMKSAKPKEGVMVEVYDYQKQLLASGETNNVGVVNLGVAKSPYFTVAKSGKERGYMKMSDGNSLSLSRFDISGTAVKNGLKGFIYGERGVWRPGDSIFLTYIMKNENPLPAKHPIVIEFKNPQGQVLKKEIFSKNNTGFYTFQTKTDQDAPTGNYYLNVSIGSVNFGKTVKVETIKPNRLKIKLDFEKKILQEGKTETAEMNVKWLHGAIAKDLKVQTDVSLNPAKTTFNKYSDFSFDDPTKNFYNDAETIFDGKTDENGNVTISTDGIETGEESPGMLNAVFFTKVFEKGGNFSVDQYSLPFSPYEGYVGVKLPKGDKMRGMLLTDKTHEVEFITLDPEGKLLKESHNLEVKFYKLSWRWWWDASSNSVSSYNFRNSAKLLKEGNIKTSGGKAKWDLEVKYPDWGRYFVYTRDLETGHSSGKIVYIDWPGWAGRAQKGDTEGAAMLTFTSDKKKYEVGEEAKIMIPTGQEGRALISIENGTKVIQTNWIKTQKGETEYKFRLTKDMTPNIYVHVSLLQKHAQTANDLPIRMYGVVPLMVEDPKTHLNPVLTMPNTLEAEKSVTIKVSEKDNKPMTYTVAVVDEGLLDLTRFKTPNPWDQFYAKEALGVKTWDIYNEVIGAYAGKLERLLSIGGGIEEDREKGKKANRFKPVVKFLGPFTLKKGTNTHTFIMPQYIGSVKTMIVAGNGSAFGSSEKATPVIKPLMLLGTLPRVLGPKEKVKLPISIFAMKKDIKNVTIKVETNKLLSVSGQKSKTLKFNEPGEKDITFDLDVKSKIGIGKVKIIATSGSYSSTYNIELDVRNPNHEATDVIAKVMQKGETWTSDFDPIGIAGTNKGMLEISSIPPINLENRLNYLIQYPHGCIEQTTSSVFPQLFVSNLIKIEDKKKKEIERNIKAGVKRLKSFQISNGGFAYWQGGNTASLWGTNYAGHFLIEADKLGYSVSSSVMKKWRKYQKNEATKWRNNNNASQLVQAYRLYTLALAGYPEKGAMNRMKNISNLSPAAKWRLAATYFLTGKKKTATSMVAGITTNIVKYNELAYTYGSDVRDKAMILETLTLLEDKTKAFGVLKQISDALSEKKYLSTQTTAYALLAVSKFVKDNAGTKGMKYKYSVDGGKSISISDKKSVSQQIIKITETNSGKIKVVNNSGGILYARVILQGIPDIGTPDDSQNSLNMSVSYKLPDGSSLSPDNIPQGTDFIAEVTISNPGLKGDYDEIALTQVFPSGWEIINTRLFNLNIGKQTSAPEYIDIRDDRVYTYFDLKRNKSKTFRVMLNASYAGEYWMSPVYCEAMYDATINARRGGKYVKVKGLGSVN